MEIDVEQKEQQVWHDIILKLYDSLSGERQKRVNTITEWIKVLSEEDCSKKEIEQRVRSILTVYNK